MKKIMIFILGLTMSASLLALEKADVIKNVTTSMIEAFGGATKDLGSFDKTEIQKFSDALDAVKKYVLENYTDLVGNKDATLVAAADDVVKQGRSIIATVGVIISLSKAKELKALRTKLEESQESLDDTAKALDKANFSLTRKKNSREVLDATMKVLNALVKKTTNTFCDK